MLIDGPSGWGEFAPFVEYDDLESSRWLAAGIRRRMPPSRLRARRRPRQRDRAGHPAGEVPAVLARFDGCTTAKVKVAESGQSLADDLDRVAAVREAIGQSARIRVDANGGWDLETAVTALARLAAYDLEYAEHRVRAPRTSLPPKAGAQGSRRSRGR